jgi:hypothetical protein
VATPIVNASFETGSDNPGVPEGWLPVQTPTLEIVAAFGSSHVGYDGMEDGWKLPNSPASPPFNEDSLFELEPPNVAFATFSANPYENFEVGWDNDAGFLDDWSVLTIVEAQFDTAPEPHEDYEEDWKLPKAGGAPFNQGSEFSWDDVSTATAMFDAGTPEAFEDFEEEWDDNEDSFFTFAAANLEGCGIGTSVNLGSYNWTTSAFANGAAYTPPAYAVITFAEVTTTTGALAAHLTVAYIDGLGVGGNDGGVDVPATSTVGMRFKVVEQIGATGVRDVTSITESPPIGAQAGVVDILGFAKDTEDFENEWTLTL